MHSASLSGFGVAPAELAALPSAVAFPATLVNTTSAPEAVVFTNTGDATAGLLGMPSISAPFQLVSSTCTGELRGGASCVVFVTFSPTGTGQASRGLSLSSTSGGTATVTLTGAGQSPASLTISDTNHLFTSVKVGLSESKSFTVGNGGGAPSGPLNYNVTGYPAFSRTGGTCVPGAPLSPGASCTIEVTFSPSVAGARMGTLEVSATPGGALTAMLRGTGT